MSIQLEEYNGTPRLEKWSGTKSRFTCPSCNSKNDFTRFVDDDGKYLPDDVGICNRASKCGYSYTAKQFFANNPQSTIGLKFGSGKRKGISRYGFATKSLAQATQTPKTAYDFIPVEHLKKTIGNYEQNAFVHFLLNLFPDCIEEIQTVLEMYFVGTYPDNHGFYTCFPYIDQFNRICRAKLIRFNSETGKRLKGKFDTSSLPAKLKLKEDFNYNQVFFGEHLLNKYPNKPVVIVEAEKSTCIASLCLPEFVWLGSNSKQWLKAERLQRLDKRQIILCPDADGYQSWGAIAKDARRLGLNVKMWDLIKTEATDEQKKDGYDIADHLIEKQSEINTHNQAVDAHNQLIDAKIARLDKEITPDYEPDEQDLLDARLEREAILEYETASA